MRDRTRDYRLFHLSKDAAAIDQIATRVAGLVEFMRHAAKDCSDHATAARIDEWAQSLIDVTGTDLAAVVVAHEAACDDEDAEPMLQLDPVLAVMFGMPLPKDAAPIADWVAP